MSLYDHDMACTAQAIEQCLTLGGRILEPKDKPSLGFQTGGRVETPTPPPPRPPSGRWREKGPESG